VWAFFGESAADEVFSVTKGKWKEKANKRFDELAQEEYETMGRRYLQSKPEWEQGAATLGEAGGTVPAVSVPVQRPPPEVLNLEKVKIGGSPTEAARA
jgi:hypothetical protein